MFDVFFKHKLRFLCFLTLLGSSYPAGSVASIVQCWWNGLRNSFFRDFNFLSPPRLAHSSHYPSRTLSSIALCQAPYTVFYVILAFKVVSFFRFSPQPLNMSRIRYDLKFDALIVPCKYSLPTFYRKRHFLECIHEHLLEERPTGSIHDDEFCSL